MEEIRCPMCGKPNPDHLEICQHCQARLKPLIMSWQDDSAAGTNEPDSGLPDWLRLDQSDEATLHDEAPPEADSEDDDWLTRLRREGDSEPVEIPPPDEHAESGEPESEDWLLRIRAMRDADAEIPQEDASSSDDESSIFDGTLPSWMTGKDEKPAEEKLPDWLTTISEEPAAAATPKPVEEPEGGIPEWLSTVEKAEPGYIPKEESTDNGIPDWMSGVEEEALEPELSTIPAEPTPQPLDWLSGLEAGELGWPAAAEPAEDLEPDWLEKIGKGADADLVPKDDVLSPLMTDEGLFEIGELSDLLSGIEQETKIPEGAEEAGLVPAELPGWLEAMRPVDSAAEGAGALDRGPIEQAGPLAGLSGVLKAEPEIARLKQAPKLSSRLQVSEAQQNHVKVLRDLLATEGQARPLPQPIVISSQGVLRWVSAFLLIFVIGLATISESQLAPSLPQASVPAEVLRISELINSISPHDSVLVSFDYEPGTSGEMDAAAAAVVDHLMLRGAYLTLVSTSPTGPALAEHFIATRQAEHHYVSGNQYINLGYIPGGATGLLGFVQTPQRIKPLSFDGFDPWVTAPLEGIYSLSDFEMVLVITDDPDTARSWIEQVQPKLQGAPLIAVVSAQAEPILHPYVGGESAQVRGMVSGIIGGAAYEQVTGKPNVARLYWDALNFALITAIAVILIGGIINVFSILFRKKEHREAS